MCLNRGRESPERPTQNGDNKPHTERLQTGFKPRIFLSWCDYANHQIKKETHRLLTVALIISKSVITELHVKCQASVSICSHLYTEHLSKKMEKKKVVYI